MKPPVTIIVPTWNNPQFLNPCIDSIRATGVLNGLCNLLIVNNGQQPIKEYVQGWRNTEVLEPKQNLGWERGLELGLKHSDSPFVVFQNDDTVIPHATSRFYYSLLSSFNDDSIGAVGPATTNASGWHSIFQKYPLGVPSEVSFLIFFTVMMRRAHLDMVGGIDTSCPGGDDIDLSIRLRKAGKKLVVNPNAFIIHHAFKTGERVRGGPEKVDGWNSREMIDRTNKWLIQKHGFKTFMETMRGLELTPSPSKDLEGDIVRSFVDGGKVVELGCGPIKTVADSVGIDRIPKGEVIPHVGRVSVADIVADVSDTLPLEDKSFDVLIARHILEHCVDAVKVIKEWSRVLKVGGKMVIAVPNEKTVKGIPLNPEHVHGFTPESLDSLMGVCGFKSLAHGDPENGISFVTSYEKLWDSKDHDFSCEVGSKVVTSSTLAEMETVNA